MEILGYTIPVLLMKMVAFMPGFCSAGLSHYVHPESTIEVNLTPGEFDKSMVCWVAYHILDWREVHDIQICSVMRIEAPLSGYLVDAVGEWEKDGRIYTIFRVGVRDGEEYPQREGEEFVFLAGGFSESGTAYIHPPRAGIEDPEGSFSWEHEFLLDTDEFLAIPRNYPR